MVRFESGKNQGPPAKPYVYDKTYTSFWDAVLQEQQQQQQPGGNSNDTSFEKSDIPLKKKKPTTISTDNNTTDNTTDNTSTKSKMMMHDDDRSEHKEEEQVLSSSTPSPLKTPPRTVETTLARTQALLEAHAAAASNDTTTCTSTSTSSPTKEEEEVPSDESKADSQQRIQQQLAVHDSSSVSVHVVPDVVVKTTPAPSVVKTLSASPTESPTYTCSEESVDTETHLSPSLITSPAIETADKKDAIQHLMAQVVLDAAKKELEARKKQQPVETPTEEPPTPELQIEAEEEEEHTTTTPTPQQEDTPPPPTLESTLQMPMDAEALAKAQAQLMEQAKSLAKAQALLEAQAKQLARQQELQQLTMETSSPLKPKIQVEEIPRQAPLPTLTKPSAFRAPSDECRISATQSHASSSSRLVAAFNSPAITTTVTRMSSSDVHSSTDTVPIANTKTLARLSSNDLNSSIDSIPDDDEVPHIPRQRNNKTMPDSDEINAAMDGDWLSRARSEAKAKAQALLQAAQVEATARAKEAQALIQAAQAEAAARAQARADAKAAALAQEKARQKAEIEAQLQAKAVRDAWDFEQMRAQVQMEERIKSKLRASAKAEAEAKLRYKAELDAVAVQKQHMAAARAQADIGKLRQLAKEQAEAKLRRKAEEDAKLVQQQQDAIAAAQATARRKRQEVEEARLAAKAEVERKIQLKAEIDAQKWAAAEARAKQEAERRALAAATAKVRARHSKELQLPTQLSAAQRKAKAIAGTTDPSPLQPHHAQSQGVPKDFVPFGKSKGEEADGNICLYLQVPGVVHVSEVKVELEDGVLYISRGIVLPGRGLQKYTRSFPFEENLLDTSKISVTLIPTNATADGVSVLKFSLPKVQPTWNVPLSLVDEDASLSASGGRHTTSKDDGSGGDLEDLTDVSLLDAPDDEVHTLHHPSDELRNSSTHAPDDEKAADPEDLQKTYNKDGCRFVELLQLPVAFALENIVATYSEETVTVVGTEGDEERTSFRHVVPMSTQDVDVRQLTGSYDPNVGRLVLKAPLHSSIPKSRRIRVVKKEDSETIIEAQTV
ncbi:Inherit from bactNOG: Cell surface protein [Seminavis robusta]|uniref:Inherit from bactNOG: Cell surface protein n=1 Tax=Seminavis robusta TaxID=568900 RepID=A0A9N8D998_9STRA|nr:Inherit from bactNOG: Cell surface protein [Seminavis robusta]|eukprot:Sro21_g014730.1 Inherit from bactNOG: Cell surface protein (1062) ;mRNA; f:85221-88485